jgi:competence/damage-inducible protein CinA-like protein
MAVGSELLRPGCRETHSERIVPVLEAAGLEMESRRVVSDRLDEIEEALREALSRPRVILVTGGIGPTRDDRTRDALARALGAPLRPDAASEHSVRRWCRRHRIPFTRDQARQTLLPEGTRALRNPVGSAPGIWYSGPRGTVLVLPGVFGEMWPMLHAQLPRLARLGDGPVATAILRTAGPGESRVDRRIAPAVRKFPEAEVTTLASPGETLIQIRTRGGGAGRKAARCRDAVAAVLGRDLVSAAGETLEEVVLRLLRRRRWTLATAESCTAGLVSARLTSVAGSSAVYLAGAVCYNDRAKARILSVPEETLRKHGAVSRSAALAMARGAVSLTGARVAVAVTGIAGPGGGTPRKPVGSVHWAVVSPSGVRTVHRILSGDRGKVRNHSAAIALDLVRRALLPRNAGASRAR